MGHSARQDEGLRAAIAVAGSISQLARMIGVSQPTVSIWRRIPPHRVIQIEGLTGLSRRMLRPDLYDVPEPAHMAQAESRRAPNSSPNSPSR